MDAIQYKPIGIIHSPFQDRIGMPIQPLGAKGISGFIDLDTEYVDGLKDLQGFSHIILIYDFHKSGGYSLQVKPFLDDTLRGIFATRAPRRPNSIGISVVRLERIEGITIHISNVDILDGTPLLDIKPYVPNFDGAENIRTGWLEDKSMQATGKESDGRFKVSEEKQ